MNNEELVSYSSFIIPHSYFIISSVSLCLGG
jgi:hypothetical protein